MWCWGVIIQAGGLEWESLLVCHWEWGCLPLRVCLVCHWQTGFCAWTQTEELYHIIEGQNETMAKLRDMLQRNQLGQLQVCPGKPQIQQVSFCRDPAFKSLRWRESLSFSEPCFLVGVREPTVTPGAANVTARSPEHAFLHQTGGAETEESSAPERASAGWSQESNSAPGDHSAWGGAAERGNLET